MASNQRDPEREALWREVLAKQAASGLNVREFCRREQLAETSFFAWRRTIRERDGNAKSADDSPQFVPAVVTDPPPGDGSIAIELAGGCVLRLPSSTTTARLVELVTALETRGAR